MGTIKGRSDQETKVELVCYQDVGRDHKQGMCEALQAAKDKERHCSLETPKGACPVDTLILTPHYIFWTYGL
jgi:hypothetical protein